MSGTPFAARCAIQLECRQIAEISLEIGAKDQRSPSRLSGAQMALADRRVDDVATDIGVNSSLGHAECKFVRLKHKPLRQRSTDGDLGPSDLSSKDENSAYFCAGFCPVANRLRY